MKNTLLAYKIGLAGIGIFVLSLVIYVATQAGATKQDTQTYNAANSISQKLDTYIDSQGTIPDTLQTAGVSSVPSTISYAKLSDSSYKFCATYKTKDSGFDSGTSIIETIAAAESPISGTTSSSADALYISPAHKKGENCQTITPPFLSSDFSTSNNSDNSFDNSFGNPSDTYQLTDPTQVD